MLYKKSVAIIIKQIDNKALIVTILDFNSQTIDINYGYTNM